MSENDFNLMWDDKALSYCSEMGFYSWVFFHFVILLSLEICSGTKQDQYCAASSCGKVTNISYPFRLKQDPVNCGDPKYELDCTNNVTVLHLNSAEYHVEAINYNNYTIRLVDPDVQEGNCSSMPRYFLFYSNFSDFDDQQVDSSYEATQAINEDSWSRIYLFQPIIFLSCANPVRDDASYVDTTSCIDSTTYAIVGDMDIASWKPGCNVKAVSPTSWTRPASLSVNSNANDSVSVNVSSYLDIHRQLVYGFELSWMQFVCDSHCGSRPCFIIDHTIGTIQCYIDDKCYYINGGAHSCGILVRIGIYTKASLYGIFKGLYWLITFRAIHLDDANAINRAVVVGYYGLPSFVAARFLFGATLLIAIFVHKWRRRHLSAYENIENFLQDYDLMPIRYSYKEIKKMTSNFNIKLGQGGFGSVYKGKLRSGPYVALVYLHQGCDMQILHFDIKPHNILLDENFIPKISDFGLAKLYTVNDSIVTLTAARGTLGYMAPELFYKNIGRISYKADVYSFGMLLMEMAGKRRNSNPHAEHSSQDYFPTWIYDQFSDKKDIELKDATEEEKKMVKKMFITALWCIQLKPRDRPSMNEVVQMLEGEMESLKMPPRPSFYPEETIANDLTINSDATISSEVTTTSINFSWEASDHTPKSSPRPK